jgi:hypothetical protein
MTGPMLHTVDVDRDARTIYEAITTKAGETAFWTSDCDVEPAIGSIARFGFPGAPVDLRMQIDTLEPERTVRWSCSAISRIGPGPRSPGRYRPRRPKAGPLWRFATTVGATTTRRTNTRA